MFYYDVGKKMSEREQKAFLNVGLLYTGLPTKEATSITTYNSLEIE